MHPIENAGQSTLASHFWYQRPADVGCISGRLQGDDGFRGAFQFVVATLQPATLMQQHMSLGRVLG